MMNKKHTKLIFILTYVIISCNSFGQAFSKSTDIGSSWSSSDATHIASSTANPPPVATYVESNISPSASGPNTIIFNNCQPINTTYTLTSPVISSIGRSNIRIGFGVRRSSASIGVVSLAYFNGTDWIDISSDINPGADDQWFTNYFDLPSDANNNSQLRFRFTLTTSRTQSCTAAPNLRIDDFWVGQNFKLPIQLNSFEVNLLNDRPKITWTILSELNNHHFLIEKSKDNIEFKEFTQVKSFGNGTSDKQVEYSFIDKTPGIGKIYYRLKQIDIDGTVTIFPSKAIFIHPDKILVYPTIVEDKVNLFLHKEFSTEIYWCIVSPNGQIILRGSRSIDNTDPVTLSLKKVPPGIYFLKTFADGNQQSFKLIKPK